MSSAALSPEKRNLAMAALEEKKFDVIVVGGGVTGAGAALDAASRGLSVALIEQHDFASGTSSKSSKLIHGGLRYLEMLDFKLVREALRERGLLFRRLAPHLVRPVRFTWPLTHKLWERAYVGAGLALYDTIGGAGAFPTHQHISRRRLLREAPSLDADVIMGGVQFYDAIEDDARMVMTIARTAQQRGADVLTGIRALKPVRDGEGALIGLTVQDEHGRQFVAQTSQVAYAVGAWSNNVSDDSLRVRPSKGVHVMVPHSAIQSNTGIIMRTEKSVLFIIPWNRHWLIGDTDTVWPHDPGKVVATGGDIDYLLDKANSILSEKLTRRDVVGTFVGLRPLVESSPDADSSKISREHAISSPEQGVTLIAGGKYTTYRVMAKDLIDSVLGKNKRTEWPSRTHQIPLLGAEGFFATQSRSTEIARENGLQTRTVDHLIGRYGDRIEELLAAYPELRSEIDGYSPYIWAEIAYACSHEGARSVTDILERRTRIRIEYADSGEAIIEHVAEIAAGQLGWSEEDRIRNVSDYRKLLRAETAGLGASDDAAAIEAIKAIGEAVTSPPLST